MPPIQDKTSIYGRWMMHATWIIGLALATYIFQETIHNRENPNQNLEAKSTEPLVLKQNHHGHYIANGFINNHEVTFLLDTGATNVTVSKKLANKLNLPVLGDALVNTANGTIEVSRTMIKKINLANLTSLNINAFINSHMPDDTVLLGMSFLKNLTLIQKGAELTIINTD